MAFFFSPTALLRSYGLRFYMPRTFQAFLPSPPLVRDSLPPDPDKRRGGRPVSFISTVGHGSTDFPGKKIPLPATVCQELRLASWRRETFLPAKLWRLGGTKTTIQDVRHSYTTLPHITASFLLIPSPWRQCSSSPGRAPSSWAARRSQGLTSATKMVGNPPWPGHAVLSGTVF